MKAPSLLIDAKIASIRDWRGEALSRMRALIRQADAKIVESVKWRKLSNPSGVPVWEHEGILCTGEAFRDKVKITFAKGAKLEDPASLFNASLDGNSMRAIDLSEGGHVDESAFVAIVRAAVELNDSNRAASRASRASSTRKPSEGR